MPHKQNINNSIKRADSAIATLFFMASFAYTLLIIKPQLVYHALSRLTPNAQFSTGIDFMLQTIRQPAGLLNYLAAFTAHCFSIPLLGTAIITAIAMVLYIATRLILNNSRPSKLLSITAFLPALLVLTTYTRYANQTRDYLILITATFAFIASNRFADRTLTTKLSIFICIFIALYIAALPAAFIFAALYSLSALLTKKSRLTGPAALIASTVVYIITTRHLDTPIIFSTLQIAYTLPPDKPLIYPVSAIYIYFPLITAAASLFPYGTINRKKQQPIPSQVSTRKAITVFFLKIALLLTVSITILRANQTQRRKGHLLINYLTTNKQWSRTLQAASKHPPSTRDFLEIHDINRALFHSGKLSENMFNYPQSHQSLLLNIEIPDVWSEIYHRRCTIMYELGYPGLAEKFAYEILVYNNHTPFTLEMLARIYIIKQNPDTARTFLNALAKQPFRKTQAQTILNDLHNGTFTDFVTTNSVVEKDIIDFTFQGYEFYAHLIDKNPKNKMAFEYMMAFFMLTKDLDRFAACLPLIKNYGYETFPTHYAEALITYKFHRNKDIPLESLPIDQSQIKMGINFFKALALRDPATTKKLMNQYAGTYYNYYAFVNR